MRARADLKTSPATQSDPSFDLRFEGARGSLVRLCASLVGMQDAEDIVQDVYIMARNRVDQLRDPASFEAWLRRIAVNRCYEHHRRRTRLAGLVEDITSRVVSRDLGLRELIERLPSRDRTVLVLHHGHGYRLDEIAEMLSLSHGNVRSIIARTRKRLAKAWRESER